MLGFSFGKPLDVNISLVFLRNNITEGAECCDEPKLQHPFMVINLTVLTVNKEFVRFTSDIDIAF